MGREAALERQAQGRQLRPQLALGELGQGGGVCLTLAERAQHRLAGGAEHIARDVAELDVGVLEQLLQAVGLTRALPDERLAIAGQVAQLADRFRRHEAGAHQPVLEQLAEPLGVLDVGLAAGHVLDVLGVDEPELEVVLEQVVDGLPVDAGGLHRNVRDAEPLEPVAQRQQLAGHGLKLGAQLRAPALLIGHVHAGGHLALVDVERTAALQHTFHLGLPSDRLIAVVRGSPLLRDSARRARGDSSVCRGLPSLSPAGLVMPERQTASKWTTDRVSLISSVVCDGPQGVMASPATFPAQYPPLKALTSRMALSTTGAERREGASAPPGPARV